MGAASGAATARQAAATAAANGIRPENPHDTLRRRLEERRSDISALLPEHMTFERLEYLMLLAVDEDYKLLNCAASNKGLESFVKAACAAAVMGLEPGRLKGEAFIGARQSQGEWVAEFGTTYQGDLRLLYRSNSIKSIRAEVVYEKDVFEIDLASNRPPTHKPFMGRERGDAVGAYAVVHLANGEWLTEWMPQSDLDKAMSHTRMVRDGRIYGPWDEWAGEMSKKSVIRRMAKRLPLDPAVQVLMAQDQTSDYSPRPDPEAAAAAAETLRIKDASPALESRLTARPEGDATTDSAGRKAAPAPKDEKPKPDFKPNGDASVHGATGESPAPKAPPQTSVAAPKAQPGPTITGGQASLLRHLMEQAKLTGEAGAKFLQEKAKVSKIEDLTPAAYKAVLAEVQSRLAA